MRHFKPHSALPPYTEAFYREASQVLQRSGVPFLVGGAYALWHYTGIFRNTKDFDIFMREADVEQALSVLADAGFRTELTFPHWLGKAYRMGGHDFVDIIFSSGNGVAVVDEAWFDHSAEGEVLGMQMKLCPPEEMIWSKAFVVERERYDGADIAHLFRAKGATFDWQRMLHRFDRNWRVLLSHIVLFGYIYPSDRENVPQWVHEELLGRMQQELCSSPPSARVCQGTLLSRAQYLVDVNAWGYEDARLRDDVHMNEDDIELWTAAIEGKTANDGDHDKGSADASCRR